MGWKGTLRSMNAAAKRAEKYQREVEKHNQIVRAHEAVNNYNNYLEDVVSFHKFCSSQKVSWEVLRDMKAPAAPVNDKSEEISAKLKLDKYVPNFFIKLFKLENWRRRSFEVKIIEAIELDFKNYKEARDKYSDDFNEWNENKQMATMIIEGNLEGYEKALIKYDTFRNAGSYATGIKLSMDDGALSIDVTMKSISEVIPKQSAKVLKNGTISEKEIPNSKYQSMCQDFVCSALLRVARECLTLFPVDSCVVNAKMLMLDRSSGHMREQIILSMQVPRATMEYLNFNNVDPSDALGNFVHNMDFKTQSGFFPVEKIEQRKKIA